MTPGDVRALEDRICLPFPKLLPAQAHARTERVAGITAYRCAFGKHWHAEVLPLDVLALAAELMRDRHNGATTTLESQGQAG